MILFVGDVHNKIAALEAIVCAHPEAGAVLQVGDLVPQAPGVGIPEAWWRPMRLPIRFIDGNHHNYKLTRDLRTPTEVLPGLIYCPRGAVEEIDGRRVGFLGGAESHTPKWRARGVDYWPDEEGIRDADLEPLLRLARRGRRHPRDPYATGLC